MGRQGELAGTAAARMKRLGYDNVEIVHGDGSTGWPEEAPFEAILAAASGSHVPEALMRQLTVGGTLVMPVGEPGAVQSLVKVRRLGDDDFDQEDLGPVRFVPLIGEHGWGDGNEKQAKPRPSSIEERIAGAAQPLPDIDEHGFAAAFDRFADARVILLGEASHGTSEFYRARAAITRRLIESQGFTIVAAGARWAAGAFIEL